MTELRGFYTLWLREVKRYLRDRTRLVSSFVQPLLCWWCSAWASAQAARCGADWIDIEYAASWQTVLSAVGPNRVILSYHNFDETPASLSLKVGEMARTGAGVLKVVTKANRLRDNLTIASTLAHAASRKINLCALAMGPRGVPSRVLGPVWGS
jgi:3-dehydroquinate dehydratase type I